MTWLKATPAGPDTPFYHRVYGSSKKGAPRRLANRVRQEYNPTCMYRRYAPRATALLCGTSKGYRLIVVLMACLAACSAPAASPPAQVLRRAQQAWRADWHAVWQIEWAGAPVRGPLVAEVWRAADGRLRIETLEAPTPALANLTLVSDGQTAWLYDARHNRVAHGRATRLRLPLANDALEVWDWLLAEAKTATLADTVHRDLQESGPASRLELVTRAGDQASLWLDDQTGLPVGLHLHTEEWSEVRITARRIERPSKLASALFEFQVPAGAKITYH